MVRVFFLINFLKIDKWRKVIAILYLNFLLSDNIVIRGRLFLYNRD